jgi:hypothetical protein
MLASKGFDIFGQVSQGRAAANQGKYEYEISKINANAIAVQGQEELRQATEEAELIKKAGEELVASQIAGFATSGVTMSGTVPVVLTETVAENKLDQIRTLKAGMAAEAIAGRQATAELAKGQMAKFRGRSAATSSYLSAFGTALTGAYEFERDYGGSLGTSSGNIPTGSRNTGTFRGL